MIGGAKVSFDVGFIGIGQGGCKIAKSFMELGYKAIFLNTAEIDLESLKVDGSLTQLIGEFPDGAGKNPDVSRLAVEHSHEEIKLKIEEHLSDCDRIMVCAGSGGGTGSGGCLPVADISRSVIGTSPAGESKVGLILTIPRRLECSSSVVRRNALELLSSACARCESGEFAPMMVVNNRRIKNVVPNATMRTMWQSSNSYISSLFHEFNTMTQVPSEFECMDRADLETIMLRPGCVSYGRGNLDEDATPQNIKSGIMRLFTNTIFSHSESPIKSQSFGIILKVPTRVFDENENFFETFEKGLQLVIQEIRGGHLHKGIYESTDSDRIEVYCISRGLKGPERSSIQDL